jgi:aminoglycoside N3'-acetyltransferase
MSLPPVTTGTSTSGTNSNGNVAVTFAAFTELLRDLVTPGPGPVVAYCGVFTIARALPEPLVEIPQRVLQCLLEAVGPERTLLMPVYTRGFVDGRIDLEREPGTTGMVNELLRTMTGTRRTASAFFSFAANGPEAAVLADLRPIDAWGKGSVFEWIEQRNARIMVIGVPWAHCSFLHRAEWNVGVPYRTRKMFAGIARIHGRDEPLRECLYVRSLDPLAENTWPELENILSTSGMRQVQLGRGHVGAMSARGLLAAIEPLLQENPFRFVKNGDALNAAITRTAADSKSSR